MLMNGTRSKGRCVLVYKSVSLGRIVSVPYTEEGCAKLMTQPPLVLFLTTDFSDLTDYLRDAFDFHM